jgi:hypothetical protein
MNREPGASRAHFDTAPGSQRPDTKRSAGRPRPQHARLRREVGTCLSHFRLLAAAGRGRPALQGSVTCIDLTAHATVRRPPQFCPSCEMSLIACCAARVDRQDRPVSRNPRFEVARSTRRLRHRLAPSPTRRRTTLAGFFVSDGVLRPRRFPVQRLAEARTPDIMPPCSYSAIPGASRPPTAF